LFISLRWSCHCSIHARNAILEGIPGTGKLVVVLNPEVCLAQVVGKEKVFPLLMGAEPPTFFSCDVKARAFYMEVCWL